MTIYTTKYFKHTVYQGFMRGKDLAIFCGLVAIRENPPSSLKFAAC